MKRSRKIRLIECFELLKVDHICYLLSSINKYYNFYLKHLFKLFYEIEHFEKGIRALHNEIHLLIDNKICLSLMEKFKLITCCGEPSETLVTCNSHSNQYCHCRCKLLLRTFHNLL